MVKRDTSKSRVIATGVLLLLGACLLPGVVSEGTWRAWVAVPAGILVLCLFLYEVSAMMRERRRPPSAG
jgi:hypothetical protein